MDLLSYSWISHHTHGSLIIPMDLLSYPWIFNISNGDRIHLLPISTNVLMVPWINHIHEENTSRSPKQR